jgi:hypothetical protein
LFKIFNGRGLVEYDIRELIIRLDANVLEIWQKHASGKEVNEVVRTRVARAGRAFVWRMRSGGMRELVLNMNDSMRIWRERNAAMSSKSRTSEDMVKSVRTERYGSVWI